MMWFNSYLVERKHNDEKIINIKLKNILSFVNNNKYIFMILISIIALILRLKYLNNAGGDYDGFLGDWSKYLRDNGGFKAITSVDTDYNVLYLYFLAFFTYLPIRDLYLIKFLSFSFDFIP